MHLMQFLLYTCLVRLVIGRSRCPTMYGAYPSAGAGYRAPGYGAGSYGPAGANYGCGVLAWVWGSQTPIGQS